MTSCNALEKATMSTSLKYHGKKLIGFDKTTETAILQCSWMWRIKYIFSVTIWRITILMEVTDPMYLPRAMFLPASVKTSSSAIRRTAAATCRLCRRLECHCVPTWKSRSQTLFSPKTRSHTKETQEMNKAMRQTFFMKRICPRVETRISTCLETAEVIKV